MSYDYTLGHLADPPQNGNLKKERCSLKAKIFILY
jgi:hypothetical protein